MGTKILQSGPPGQLLFFFFWSSVGVAGRPKITYRFISGYFKSGSGALVTLRRSSIYFPAHQRKEIWRKYTFYLNVVYVDYVDWEL
jgi:hypothetical protein